MYTYKEEIIYLIVRNLAFAGNTMDGYEKKKGIFCHSIAQVTLLPDEGQTEGNGLKQEGQKFIIKQGRGEVLTWTRVLQR